MSENKSVEYHTAYASTKSGHRMSPAEVERLHGGVEAKALAVAQGVHDATTQGVRPGSETIINFGGPRATEETAAEISRNLQPKTDEELKASIRENAVPGGAS